MIHPNTMIKLYLIRHVQSEANCRPEIVMGRSLMSPATSIGVEQSQRLGSYLKHEGIRFDRVYCSPARRAIETTVYIPIADMNEPPELVMDERLVEYTAGEWEGQPRDEVYTPDIILQMAKMTIDFQPPGGESQRQVMQRAGAWLQDAILDNDPLLTSGNIVRIAAFSHGLVIKCLLGMILGLNHGQIWNMTLDNASLTLLQFSVNGWRLDYINRIPI